MAASVQGNTRRRKCSMSHAKADRCALGQPTCQRAALTPQNTSSRQRATDAPWGSLLVSVLHSSLKPHQVGKGRKMRPGAACLSACCIQPSNHIK